MTAEEQVPATEKREKSVMSKIIAGTWNGKVFTASEKQPPEPLTEMAKAVAWARSNVVGTVHFMRLLPEGVVVEKVEKIAVSTVNLTV